MAAKEEVLILWAILPLPQYQLPLKAAHQDLEAVENEVWCMTPVVMRRNMQT